MFTTVDGYETSQRLVFPFFLPLFLLGVPVTNRTHDEIANFQFLVSRNSIIVHGEMVGQDFANRVGTTHGIHQTASGGGAHQIDQVKVGNDIILKNVSIGFDVSDFQEQCEVRPKAKH